MPKSTTARAARRERDQSDRPPAGMNRRQRRDWFDELNRRRALESATVADAFLVVNTPTDRPAVDEVEKPAEKRPTWRARAWDRRPLFAAVLLICGLLYVIIPPQIDYYRGTGGLNPLLAGHQVRTYLLVPVVTELLSAFFGLLGTYVIVTNKGRYRVYLRLMWFFASVAALINVKNAWQHVDDGTRVTAILLGLLSLSVPLVWHSYAGLTIAVRIRGLTVSELSRISRQWIRHPFFSYRTAQAVDLFTDMSRDQVWDMVVRRKKEKLHRKWTAPTADRAQQRLDRKDFEAAPFKVSMITNPGDLFRRYWSKTRPRVDVVDVTVDGTVHGDVHDRAPGETGGVDVLDRHPVTEIETSGEIRAREFLIAAWFDVHGEHLAEKGEQPWGYQSALAKKHGVSTALVSKLFKECRDGKHANPFMPKTPKVGE